MKRAFVFTVSLLAIGISISAQSDRRPTCRSCPSTYLPKAELQAYIDRAIALRPTDLALQQRRAQLATWAGKYPEAEKSLKMLVEANPTDVTLKRDLGRVLMWQHQLPEAAGLLGQFLADQPVEKQVLLDLSQIL